MRARTGYRKGAGYFLCGLMGLLPILIGSGCLKAESGLFEPVAAQSLDSRLDGYWHSDCVDSPSVGLSARRSITINGENFTRQSLISMTGTCETQDIDIIEAGSIKAAAGGRNAAPAPIDISVQSIRVVALTSTGAEVLNLVGHCGIDDWYEQVPREADVALCGVGGVDHTAFAIRDGRLLFGARGDHESPRHRPTELDSDVEFGR